jgi:hypothetical protein
MQTNLFWLQMAFSSSMTQKKTIKGYIITYIRVRVGDVSKRFAHELKVGEVAWLALDLLIPL